MAKGKKDKKSYLKRMAANASGGDRASAEYTRTGDYDPEEVHDAGETTYRGSTYMDSPNTPIAMYSRGVSGEGYNKFVFQKQLYTHTAPNGTAWAVLPS